MDDTTRAVARYWDDAAGAFDDEPDHGLRETSVRTAWARRLADWLPAAPADVLDLGCGTGSLALLAAEAGHRVTGVDVAPRMVEAAHAKLATTGLPGRFLAGDAGRPPTGAERYDVVLARHVVWTLPDPRAALRDWTGRLRPGGRLVLVEGRWRTPGLDVAPYVAGAESLPWDGGVTADDLAAAVRPLVTDLHVEPLDGDPDLWGHPVHDERYALIAHL